MNNPVSLTGLSCFDQVGIIIAPTNREPDATISNTGGDPPGRRIYGASRFRANLSWFAEAPLLKRHGRPSSTALQIEPDFMVDAEAIPIRQRQWSNSMSSRRAAITGTPLVGGSAW
jgi:hypothetical protein